MRHRLLNSVPAIEVPTLVGVSAHRGGPEQLNLMLACWGRFFCRIEVETKARIRPLLLVLSLIPSLPQERKFCIIIRVSALLAFALTRFSWDIMTRITDVGTKIRIERPCSVGHNEKRGAGEKRS